MVNPKDKNNIPAEPGQCEVCGAMSPPGHRFCDNCWPEKAIAAGKAALCAICGNPKVIEKLQEADGALICISHNRT